MTEAASEVQRWTQPGLAYWDTVATTNTAHEGDYMVFSGSAVVPGGNGPSAYYRVSAVGIALDNNPKWTPDGSGYHNSALPIAWGGVFRVTGQGSATAGMNCWPILNGSGIVGQTGRTGEHSVWTGAYESFMFSALGGAVYSASALPQSGVARIVRVVTRAVSGQWDIELTPPMVLRSLVGITPML